MDPSTLYYPINIRNVHLEIAILRQYETLAVIPDRISEQEAEVKFCPAKGVVMNVHLKRAQ